MGAGGESWTEDSKVVWLRRSLSESLKDQLFTTNLDTKDYYAAIRQVEVIAHRFEHSRHFKGNKGPANPLNIPTTDHTASIDSTPRIDTDVDVIMSPMGSQNHLDRNRQGQGTSKQGRLRARYVDQAELTCRKVNKLCVRCGTNTHFVAACHYLPPIRPATEIRATVAEFPTQLESHPEIIGPELNQGK